MNAERAAPGETAGETPGGGRGRESVDDVYARLRPGLVRLAHLLTGSLDMAEDVVHDAFVSCTGRWASVDVPDAYVRRAVTNHAHSALRRLGRDRDKSDRYGRRATVTLDIPELDETWDVLRCLPPRQRMALVLRFYDDRSADGVATLSVDGSVFETVDAAPGDNRFPVVLVPVPDETGAVTLRLRGTGGENLGTVGIDRGDRAG